MSPLAQFAALFGLTLVLLLGAVATGLRALRRAHIALVCATVLALAATIWAALRLGKHYDLPSAGLITPIHLTLAKIATIAFVPAACVGLMTLKRAQRRKLHGRLAWIAVALTVAAAITGTIMLLEAEPLPAAQLDK